MLPTKLKSFRPVRGRARRRPLLCYPSSQSKRIFQIFKSDSANKKHKGIKKCSQGMEYENFAERIKPLFDFESCQASKADRKDVVSISVKKGEMTTHKIVKTKFSQLNEKRFYFPNAILPLPFGHPSLRDIDEYKKNQGQRIEKYFWTKKGNLFELEKKRTESNLSSRLFEQYFATKT